MSSNKKRVCFFSGDITRSGGTERVSSIIANELQQYNKFDLCFLSLFEKRKRTFFPLEEQIKRFTLYDKEVSGAKHFFGYIYRIHRFVIREKIDILIDIDGILDMYSIPALMFTKVKLISWEQFGYYQNPYVNYRKFTRKWAARKADAIVVLTDTDRGYYEKETNIKGKLVRIYNPIERNAREHQYNLESKQLISVGRLNQEKGFDMLIDIAEIVFKKHTDWKWIILGEGEERVWLETKIREKKLEKHIVLMGKVNNVNDYYQESAIYVLTSRFEGFGLVLTEAKNMGLPCVSFRCPAGPGEIIEEEVNGYLVDCFDIEQMAEKINLLIEDGNLRKSFSDRAMVGTEKFMLNIIGEQWKKLLEEL
ncbi:glycosyltransferase family 4 protein [uncultured Eubacterium sp.]|uniref:glycosyltransferase family 4 protein n=1 Tax=uncultured Eubacterium sp. TaxID=165185 RepID=UPI0026727C03|nr:glycosyltransferase family 4 protein [uncultured Eubacterium sp.]